jgi:hypothetical protein
MRGIRMTFAHVGVVVPPSKEVLTQAIERAAAVRGIAVEHLWVQPGCRESHAVVFIVGELTVNALGVGFELGRTVEAAIPTVRFVDCVSLTP